MTYRAQAFWTVIIFMVIADQAIKWYFLQWYPQNIFIHTVRTWEFIVRLGIIGVLAVIYVRTPKRDRNKLNVDNFHWSLPGLELILAGGISNLLDLSLKGGVVDIFKTPLFYFNGADLLIILGASLILSAMAPRVLWSR